MTISSWLSKSQSKLERTNIDTARLDSLVILADFLGKDKSWILAHPEHVLQIEDIKILSTKVVQRSKKLPLAYVLGKVEFYDRNFAINNHVLVPRPESESILSLLSTLPKNAKRTIIDIGTGSGCLAISAKYDNPNSTVIASDICKSCLKLARENADLHQKNIDFVHGNLLGPIIDSAVDLSGSIILANLPYVPKNHPLNSSAQLEPSLAIFGGEDGLDLYRILFNQIISASARPFAIITESLEFQHDSLAKIASTNGYKLAKTDGLAQLFERLY